MTTFIEQCYQRYVFFKCVLPIIWFATEPIPNKTDRQKKTQPKEVFNRIQSVSHLKPNSLVPLPVSFFALSAVRYAFGALLATGVYILLVPGAVVPVGAAASSEPRSAPCSPAADG